MKLLNVRPGGLIDAASVAWIAATWAGSVGKSIWPLALIDHFRLQLAAAGLLFAVWCLARRAKILSTVTLVSLLPNLLPLAQTTFVSAPEKALIPGWSLRVICFNVLTSNSGKARVCDYLQQQDADLIVLLEVDDAWMNALNAALQASLPHQLAQPRADNFGVALFSRLPLENPSVQSFAKDGLPFLYAQIRHQDRSFRLLGVHPVPPMNAELSLRAHRQLHEIRALAQADRDTPLLVVGDFNAAPWSPSLRMLRQGTGLAFRQSGPAWRPTWNLSSPLQLPIDHSLCSAPLVIAGRQIGPDLGSDHRAQVLTLRWAEIPH